LADIILPHATKLLGENAALPIPLVYSVMFPIICWQLLVWIICEYYENQWKFNTTLVPPTININHIKHEKGMMVATLTADLTISIKMNILLL